MLYLDYQVWVKGVNKVEVGAEGREVVGSSLRALEAMGILGSRGGM